MRVFVRGDLQRPVYCSSGECAELVPAYRVRCRRRDQAASTPVRIAGRRPFMTVAGAVRSRGRVRVVIADGAATLSRDTYSAPPRFAVTALAIYLFRHRGTTGRAAAPTTLCPQGLATVELRHRWLEVDGLREPIDAQRAEVRRRRRARRSRTASASRRALRSDGVLRQRRHGYPRHEAICLAAATQTRTLDADGDVAADPLSRLPLGRRTG